MGTRTRTRRTRRMSRTSLRGLACARAEMLFRKAMAMKQYGLALRAIRLQCRLYGFKIDGPGQPASILSPEAWEKLLIDSKRRRDS